MRIGEIVEGRPEVPASHLDIALAPLHQQRGQRAGQVQALGQPDHGHRVGPRGDDPAKDPEFLADAKKSKLDVHPSDGEKLEALIKRIYATPKDLVARIAVLIK
jgi:hypothetical protein